MSKQSVKIVEKAPASVNTRIRIVQDDVYNPRTEQDNLFTLYFNSGRFCCEKSRSPFDEDGHLRDGLFAIPVYALIHGGATVSLSPFADPWDSGLAGYIYVSKDRFIAESGSKEFDAMKARKFAGYELEEYDDYLNGRIYGYVRETWNAEEREWVLVDSCYGYIGDDSIHDLLCDAGAFVDEEIAVINEAGANINGDEVFYK